MQKTSQIQYEEMLIQLDDDPSVESMLRGAQYLVEEYGVSVTRSAPRAKIYSEAVSAFKRPRDLLKSLVGEWYAQDAEKIDAHWPFDMLDWVSLFSFAIRRHGPDVYPDSIYSFALAFRNRYRPESFLMWKEPRIPLMCEVRRARLRLNKPE